MVDGHDGNVEGGGTIVRKRVTLVLGVLSNFVLPWAAYRLSEPHVGETRAIMLSAALPLVWSLAEFARNRKLDPMSMVVLGGLALSLVAIALGGSPKLLLLRGSLITGFGGLVLIGSAIVRRPLMYVFLMPAMRALVGRQSALNSVLPNHVSERAVATVESYYRKPWFRRLMTVMTAVFGLIFAAEAAVLTALVFTLPTERSLLVFPIVRNLTAGVLMLWMFLYFMPAVRRGAAEDERTETQTA